MKKPFTLICSLMAVVLSLGTHVQAQVLQSENVDLLPLTEGRTINPTENQSWWGYFGSPNQATGLGVSAADTYHCAIYIPGDDAVAGGKTIQAIRFGVASSKASDIKVWIASQLTNNTLTNRIIESVDVAQSDLDGGFADVALPEPYTIPATGVYVGYSFSISRLQDKTDNYPILVGGRPTPYGLYLRTEASIPAWNNLYDNKYGSLYLQVLLEGQFYTNAAKPSGINEVWGKTGETPSTALTVTNCGVTPMQDFSYAIVTDGVAGAERQVFLNNAIEIGMSADVTVTVPTETEHSRKTKSLVITKVNGQANEVTPSSADFLLYSLEHSYDRNVVVEEYTGTACGYCPRGLVGMDKLRQTFGDRFIGLGIHQYNESDAMFLPHSAYAPLGFSSAPSCRLNRGPIIDPYYGSNTDICDDFRKEMAALALAAVEVSGQYDADSTHVHATAQVEGLFDDLQYSLEFVLMADGLKGSTSGWRQANAYSSSSRSKVPSDMAIFASGGQYGQSSVYWTFNDVALSSSYKGGVNQVSNMTVGIDQPASAEYTLSLPTSATLKKALLYDQIYVVALIIAADGTIVNAAKAPVSAYDAPSGIDRVTDAAQAATSVVYYDLQGRIVAQPAQGIFLRKSSSADGSTRSVKVSVK